MANLITPTNLRVVQTMSGNLFELAASYLDDATQWNRIAQINKQAIRPNWFYDPFLEGLALLHIPPTDSNAGNGGLFGQ